MKSEDAKALVKNYHENKAKDELEKVINLISQAAQQGKVSVTYIFDYQKNVEILKSRDFEVIAENKRINENEEKYETIYKINWNEDL